LRQRCSDHQRQCIEVHRQLLVGHTPTFWKPTSLPPHTRPLRYLIAIAITAAVLTLRYVAGPWLGTAVPLMLLLAAPVLAAFYGGFGPGLMSTLLAGLIGVVFFVPPIGALPANAADWLRLVVFIGIGTLVSWALAARHRALLQLQAEHEGVTQVQAALALRERRIRDIIDGAPLAMLLLDGNRIVFVNGPAERLLGYTRAQFEQLTIEQLIPARFRSGHAALRAAFNQAPASRPMGAGRDLYALRRDGSEVPVEIALNHLPGEGNGGLTLTSITDISARKLAEHERAHLAGIVDASADAIVSQTLQGTVTSWNAGAARLFGHAADAMVGRPIDPLIPPALRAAEAQLLARLARGEAVDDHETERLHADGRRIRVSVALSPLRDAAGKVVGAASIARDITDRKRAERALRISEERYALAALASYNAIWDWDLATDALHWNDVMYELFGYPPASVPAHIDWWVETIHPDDRERVERSIHAVIDWQPGAAGEGLQWADEYRFRRHDGSYAVITDRGLVARDAQGRALRMIGAMSDVTAEREALATLRRQETHLAAVYQQTGAALGETDADGRFVEVNERYCELVGRTRDELLALRMQDITHPDDLAWNLPLFEKLMGSGAPFSAEKRYCRPDGSVVWVAVNVTRMQAQGEPPRGLAVALDITARKAVEAQLRDSEARFRTALDAASDILWTTDADGNMSEEQPKWAAFTGQSFAQYAGIGGSSALHPDDVELTLQLWRKAVATGTRFACEQRLRRHDGVYRRFTVRALPVREADGRVREWVGVHTDITDLREAETQLKQADRRKDEFLATLAHELRNPLAPLSNSLQILERTDDVHVIAPLRQMMSRQVAQLVRLVDDLLEVSRITSGKLKLQRSRVQLRQVIDAAIESARPQIDAQHHRLVVDWHVSDVTIDGDPLRLAQVFTNLLNNAAKYSEPGGTLTLRLHTPRPDRVSVRLRDTGIGIDPASLPRVFDLFAQIDNGADKAQGGLGIGLSLARRLVELHGGRISAASEGVGRGATFTVELPVAAHDAAAEPAAQPIANGNARCQIVVADDNRDAADSLAMILKLGGHEVHVAYDGREALHAVRAYRPHLAILDIGMPEHDGCDVARQLREEPWSRRAGADRAHRLGPGHRPPAHRRGGL
jgi:PAS domain S-box-containing protein